MKLKALIDAMDTVVPLACAAPWDNVGLLLGHDQDLVTKALVTVDLSASVLREARALGAELIIAYHPPWFRAQKRMAQDDLLLMAARAGLSLWSPHTALDSALGGTNDVLAHAAGMVAHGRAPLMPQPSSLPHSPGMGRVGALTTPCTPEAWVHAVKAGMKLAHALWAPAHALPATLDRVAVCAGAGDDMVDLAVTAGAQALVVGEMRHHTARHAVAQGLSVLALLHSNSERQALAPYAASLRQLAPGVTFHLSTSDLDPYQFV